MKRLAALMLAAAGVVAGCGERIERVDSDRDVLLDDRWNDTDLNMVSSKMVQSLLSHDAVAKAEGKPAIMVGTVANRTAEHIDVKALTDRIRTALVKSGKVVAVDETARGEIAKEYEYQASGNVDPATRKGPGKQRGPEFLLRGDVAQDVHKSGDGDTKSIWYKVTMQLTNVESNTLEWTDDITIKKVKASSGVRF